MPLHIFNTAPDDYESSTACVTYGRVTLGTITRTVMRSTTYTEPTANAERSLSSSSTNDTSGGTGARTVTITYYDAAMTGPHTTTVTMNGTTAVNTGVTNICFVESIMVATSGSSGTNAGTITLHASTGGTGVTVGTIGASATRTYWAHHYVADGKSMRLCAITGGSDGKMSGRISAEFVNPLVSNQTPALIDGVQVGNDGACVQRIFPAPPRFAGPGKFTLYVSPDASQSSTWFGSFDVYER